MSRLVRWPYREPLSMREMMDRFFNEPMADLRGWTEAAGLPPVDLFQTNDEVVVKATLPGVRAEDINICVTGDVLTLRGSMSDEAATREVTYYEAPEKARSRLTPRPLAEQPVRPLRRQRPSKSGFVAERGQGRGFDDGRHFSATCYVRERRAGEFSRSLPLQAPLVADRARAKFENGVLTLALPKADEVKPKTIIVKAK